jgi:hypothetical protein
MLYHVSAPHTSHDISNDSGLAATDVHGVVACMTVYQRTRLTRESDHRVVYRVVINTGEAVVKCVAEGVGTKVSVLGRMNYSCLLCLCGLCVHLEMLEFVGNSALSDWLHDGGRLLEWMNNQVQVAFDMAGGLNAQMIRKLWARKGTWR